MKTITFSSSLNHLRIYKYLKYLLIDILSILDIYKFSRIFNDPIFVEIVVMRVFAAVLGALLGAQNARAYPNKVPCNRVLEEGGSSIMVSGRGI